MTSIKISHETLTNLHQSVNWKPRLTFPHLFSQSNTIESYDIIEEIGRGAYGTVMAAKNLNDGEMVAIKRIENPFDHRATAKQTLRELKILRLLNHENILSLRSVIPPKSPDEFRNIFLVTELMETDLFTIIHQTQQTLLEDHIKFIAYQILRGLKYQHSANVIHRDLKPRNILINSDCEVKICDYGLARFYKEDLKTNNDFLMTDYVVSRWYRAPELLLGNESYDEKVDVWAVGCILAEIYLRRPLFKGSDWKDQLFLILQHFQNIKSDDLDFIENLNAVEFVKNNQIKDHINLSDYFIDSEISHLGFDLLLKLLAFNPEKRISIQKAIEHPFFKSFHCPLDEPVTKPLDESEFDFEFQSLTKSQLKKLIYDEVMIHNGPHSTKLDRDCESVETLEDHEEAVLISD